MRVLLHYRDGFVLDIDVDEHRPFAAILAEAHVTARQSPGDYLTCEIPEQPQGLRPIKVWTDRLEARARGARE